MKKRTVGLYFVFSCAQMAHGMQENPFLQKMDHSIYAETLKKIEGQRKKAEEIKTLADNCWKRFDVFHGARLQWLEAMNLRLEAMNLENMENCIQTGNLLTKAYEKLNMVMLGNPIQWNTRLIQMRFFLKKHQKTMGDFCLLKRELDCDMPT